VPKTLVAFLTSGTQVFLAGSFLFTDCSLIDIEQWACAINRSS